jgi:polysaccharide export outer membrane protein
LHCLGLFCLISVFACAPTDTMRIEAGATKTPPSSAAIGQSGSSDDLNRLEALWNQRQLTAGGNQDYPIGPGDVLTVSVPDVDELAQHRVRVSTRGTIELPLLGSIQAAGMSEDEVAAEIDDKLQKYMYQPQATVFVNEYHNRAVAVIGAVNHPGLVLLTSPSESLLDVVTQAGGLSGAAADQMILIPSRPGTIPAGSRFASLAASAPGQTVDDFGSGQISGDFEGARIENTNAQDARPDSAGARPGLSKTGLGAPPVSDHGDNQFQSATAHEARGARSPVVPGIDGHAYGQSIGVDADHALQLAGNDDAITFKLKGSSIDGAGRYVNLPMRPGDVLIVPGGGDVMVVGWVHQPGRFQVGSGLTVLGAIGAAGGPMYAAKTKNIALIRSGPKGGKITIPIDMDQITRGEAVDLPVQANDVIDVPYSGLRIGPYIFYSILTRMGIGGPIIPY